MRSPMVGPSSSCSGFFTRRALTGLGPNAAREGLLGKPLIRGALSWEVVASEFAERELARPGDDVGRQGGRGDADAEEVAGGEREPERLADRSDDRLAPAARRLLARVGKACGPIGP